MDPLALNANFNELFKTLAALHKDRATDSKLIAALERAYTTVFKTNKVVHLSTFEYYSIRKSNYFQKLTLNIVKLISRHRSAR